MTVQVIEVNDCGDTHKVLVGERDGFDFPGTAIVLGAGHFGVVQVCMSNRTAKFAAKLHHEPTSKREADLSIALAKREQMYAKELMSHENIVRFVCIVTFFDELDLGPEEFVFERPIFIYELERGGNLINLMLEGPLNEAQNRRLIQQLLSGLVFMHSKQLMHRDLKPKSILLSDSNPNTAIVKIGGLSTVVKDNNQFEEQLDLIFLSEAFASPELVFLKKCDRATDVWSAGVIIYHMMTHEYPYCQFNHTRETKDRLGREEYKKIKFVTDECRDLVSKMLRTNKSMRITAAEALSHPWFSVDAQKLFPADESIEKNPRLQRQITTPEKPTSRRLKYFKYESPALTPGSKFELLKDQRKQLTNMTKTVLRTDALQKYLEKEQTRQRASLVLFNDNQDNSFKLFGKMGKYKIEQCICANSNYTFQVVKNNKSDKEFVARFAKVSNTQALAGLIIELEAFRAFQSHNNIVKLKDNFVAYAEQFDENGEHLGQQLIGFNLYEACDGNLEQLSENYFFTEASCRNFVEDILNGLRHMHYLGYLHGDLKPKNILITRNQIAKISDFTTAVFMENDFTYTFGATPAIEFTSPEFTFAHACKLTHDIWSVGVILYKMIEMDLPFIRYHESDMSVSQEELERFATGIYDEMTCVSEECKDFVKKCFAPSFPKRMDAFYAIVHPWFQMDDNKLCQTNDVDLKLEKRRLNLEKYEKATKVTVHNYMVEKHNLLMEQEYVKNLMKDLIERGKLLSIENPTDETISNDENNNNYDQKNYENDKLEHTTYCSDLSRNQVDINSEKVLSEQQIPKSSSQIFDHKNRTESNESETTNKYSTQAESNGTFHHETSSQKRTNQEANLAPIHDIHFNFKVDLKRTKK